MSTDLDRVMNEQRVALGLTWRQVAKAAGITPQSLLAVRQGRKCRQLTEAGIERALRWARHSIAAVRHGGCPTPEEPVQSAPAATAIRDGLFDRLAALGPEQLRHVDVFVSWYLTQTGDEDHSLGTGETAAE